VFVWRDGRTVPAAACFSSSAWRLLPAAVCLHLHLTPPRCACTKRRSTTDLQNLKTYRHWYGMATHASRHCSILYLEHGFYLWRIISHPLHHLTNAFYRTLAFSGAHTRAHARRGCLPHARWYCLHRRLLPHHCSALPASSGSTRRHFGRRATPRGLVYRLVLASATTRHGRAHLAACSAPLVCLRPWTATSCLPHACPASRHRCWRRLRVPPFRFRRTPMARRLPNTTGTFAKPTPRTQGHLRMRSSGLCWRRDSAALLLLARIWDICGTGYPCAARPPTPSGMR